MYALGPAAEAVVAQNIEKVIIMILVMFMICPP
jgi:hypothetical protein